MNFKKIRHGSPDSLDKDYYVVIERPVTTNDAKEILNKLKEQYGQSFNGNLICIENGIVSWSYKGTVDEVNNSIYKTYSWFKEEQEFEHCPIKNLTNRNNTLKCVRTIRGILSYLSRTEYRETVKNALNSSSLKTKIDALEQIDLTLIKDFVKNDKKEVYKFLAFQLAQTLSLVEKNDEVFSKWDAARNYKLFDHLYRKENADVNVLQEHLKIFINYVKENILESKVEGQVYHKNLIETVNIVEENPLKQVYIFDIDNTLMNDHHRVYLREEKKWEEYFLACDKDEPIQCIIDILKDKKAQGYEIWLLTGRSDICKKQTIQTLAAAGIEYDHLKMREKTRIPDYVLKPSWAEKLIGSERIVGIYDDRDVVIDAFRAKGFNVIDVNPIIEEHNKNLKVTKKI